MNILGIDLETSGLDYKNDEIVEIGAVLWDWDEKKPVIIYSKILETMSPLTDENSKIHGISNADVKNYGESPDKCLEETIQLIDKADYVVAHNGTNFDKPFLENVLKRFGKKMPDTHWIDSVTDIEYPSNITTRKLEFLAAQHGFLNPFSHRAVTDVLTMLNVVSRYDIDKIIERSHSPNIEVKAIVSFDEKDKAKDKYFRWDAPRKSWIKNIKECDLEPLKADIDFRLEVL